LTTDTILNGPVHTPRASRWLIIDHRRDVGRRLFKGPAILAYLALIGLVQRGVGRRMQPDQALCQRPGGLKYAAAFENFASFPAS